MPSTIFATANAKSPVAENDQQTDLPEILVIIFQNNDFYGFSTYRAERVSMTSVLWSGDDWHWRFTDPAGEILADCGGYRSEAECIAVIEALRANAHKAGVPATH